MRKRRSKANQQHKFSVTFLERPVGYSLGRGRTMNPGLQIEDIEFKGESLKSRPEHAAVLGRIFTSWSLIEGAIAGLLGLMMNADQRAALAILQTFRTNSSRVGAVRKVGAEILDPKLRADFDDMMKEVLSYAEERNAIAHNLWGVNDKEPSYVYRIPMTALSGIAVRAPSMDHDAMMAHIGPLKDSMKRFTVEDLEAIERRGEGVLIRVVKELAGNMYNQALSKHGPSSAG